MINYSDSTISIVDRDEKEHAFEPSGHKVTFISDFWGEQLFTWSSQPDYDALVLVSEETATKIVASAGVINFCWIFSYDEKKKRLIVHAKPENATLECFFCGIEYKEARRCVRCKAQVGIEDEPFEVFSAEDV